MQEPPLIIRQYAFDLSGNTNTILSNNINTNTNQDFELNIADELIYRSINFTNLYNEHNDNYESESEYSIISENDESNGNILSHSSCSTKSGKSSKSSKSSKSNKSQIIKSSSDISLNNI